MESGQGPRRSSAPELVLGIDVGGTKIAAGLVDVATGALVARRELPTQAAQGGRHVLSRVEQVAAELLAEAASPVRRLGIGICELVDAQGNVQSSHTVAWEGLAVGPALAHLGVSVWVESDVRAHAQAEAWFGAGQDHASFAFVTVGTGISSALVQQRVPWAGAQGNALVLATAPVEIPIPVAPPEMAQASAQPPVQHFVLEEFASGPALLSRYAAATGEQLSHGRELAARAQSGDGIAAYILASGGAALGNALAFLANVLDPHAIVVGGGLGLAGGLYWAHMETALRRGIYAQSTRAVPLLPARLGADAGIVGAAMAAYTYANSDTKEGVADVAGTPSRSSSRQ